MKLISRILFLALLWCFTYQAKADSCEVRVSLLTCGTGEELYSSFGHTSIRVQTQGMDIVFNYGTFNFDEPDFYSKFVRGRLKYYLSAENYADFLLVYQYERRNVYEQELMLDCDDKYRIFNALRNNIQEQNKYYAYDFLKDNCTSRSAMILFQSGMKKIVLTDTLPPTPTTYRTQIHETLHSDGKFWSALGIDILMGMPADEPLSKQTYPGFLPFNLLESLNHAYTNGRKIIENTTVVMEFPKNNQSGESLLLTPLLVFSILFALLIPLTLSKSKQVHQFLNGFDRIFFGILGLLGCLLVFLTFFTDHKAFASNFNLLWALPSHLLIAFASWKSKPSFYYFRGNLILTITIIISWSFLPQQLNIGLLPILAWSGFRSYIHQFSHKTSNIA